MLQENVPASEPKLESAFGLSPQGLAVREIRSEICGTSGIIILYLKEVGYPGSPPGCRKLLAPADFIRSSSSPPSDLNPAIDGAFGFQIFTERKREEHEESICRQHEFSDDRGGFARAVRAFRTNHARSYRDGPGDWKGSRIRFYRNA